MEFVKNDGRFVCWICCDFKALMDDARGTSELYGIGDFCDLRTFNEMLTTDGYETMTFNDYIANAVRFYKTRIGPIVCRKGQGPNKPLSFDDIKTHMIKHMDDFSLNSRNCVSYGLRYNIEKMHKERTEEIQKLTEKRIEEESNEQSKKVKEDSDVEVEFEVSVDTIEKIFQKVNS